MPTAPGKREPHPSSARSSCGSLPTMRTSKYPDSRMSAIQSFRSRSRITSSLVAFNTTLWDSFEPANFRIEAPMGPANIPSESQPPVAGTAS